MQKSVDGIARRRFVGTAAAGACSVALERSQAARLIRGSKKPNILWIMSDEHNANVAGYYGNKLTRTPNVASLAERVISCDTRCCNSPLGAPSRLSLTAGKDVSRVGAWRLTPELPDANIASLPRVLNVAGCESFLCGKTAL
ncbi:MAG TPA: sulfatase-like hydrolase/transferase [Bryocella sp.]|nr:sulfatase-like hydrolase/transferase [Bryocella sp.]